MNNILTISNLHKSFDGFNLFIAANLSLRKDSVTLLTGDNGTGKSTLFNIITGFEKIEVGCIEFEGIKINGLKPLMISRLGVSRLFQTPRVFGNLTIKENLKLSYPLDCIGHISLIDKFNLLDKIDCRVGELSFGQQKIVSFCTILGTRPRLVLLDEPFAGIDNKFIPIIKQEIISKKESGTSFFIIEHNRNKILDVCNYEYCLANEKINLV